MEPEVSSEPLQRKQCSEAILASEGVPINKSLPVIENTEEARLRTKEEVAYRALALLVVAVKGKGLEQRIVERVVKDYGLASHFTCEEQAFLGNATPLEHDGIQFTWRVEAAWTLLWALGFVEKLGKPHSICDVPRAVGLMKDRTTQQFVAEAKLRPLPEILDEADLIYRYRWALVDARLNGKPTPAGMDPGVARERHYALNWLIGYMEQEWDDISTDT